MSALSTDPFDVKNEDEFNALVNVVVGKIKYILQTEFGTHIPGTTASPYMMREFLRSVIFTLDSKYKNKLDLALSIMGERDDIPENIVDSVCFVREFMLRFITKETIEKTLICLRNAMQ